MPFPELIGYAALQGVSEFLPISSSAHLLLLTRYFSFQSVPPFMEMFVHLGSLGVLIVYFWQDIGRLIRGALCFAQNKPSSDRQFLTLLFLASVPAVTIGLILDKTLGRAMFERLDIIGWTTLIFGGLLYVADRMPEFKKTNQITNRSAFFGWGLAQCLAFVHGVSRSGICITYGRLSGYKRFDAVRFAFLMAIPALSGACVLKGWAFYKAGDFSNLHTLTTGAIISFGIGLATIHLMMRLLRKAFLQKLALYRVVLGLILLYGVYALGWN